eukprot:CAMPEP_0170459120 /NCGR_PEP_ID=MMETSP0123-20130129/5915_1 /TAXON_ID=182087 /ORGANISM="Favella ehrenbergii, Strain Fehren 1" /LENGTH=167 /DNA_ID=CAMNT_0010723601 /DNA_START=1081 /DNA_END=1588 /DNA_ORIENTATION=+
MKAQEPGQRKVQSQGSSSGARPLADPSQAVARAVQFFALQEPAITLDLILGLSILDAQNDPQEVEDVLDDAHVTLYNALLRDFLVLDVNLKQHRAHKLPLLGLCGPANEVENRIEENAGNFSLPEALVLAHSRYLVHLQLYKLNERLKVVLRNFALCIVALWHEVLR